MNCLALGTIPLLSRCRAHSMPHGAAQYLKAPFLNQGSLSTPLHPLLYCKIWQWSLCVWQDIERIADWSFALVENVWEGQVYPTQTQWITLRWLTWRHPPNPLVSYPLDHLSLRLGWMLDQSPQTEIRSSSLPHQSAPCSCRQSARLCF